MEAEATVITLGSVGDLRAYVTIPVLENSKGLLTTGRSLRWVSAQGGAILVKRSTRLL